MNIRYNAGEVITAMATPFDKDMNIDYKAAEKLADYLANNGSDAILIAGTTGESPTLTHEEELELLKACKSAVGSKIKVLMGAGSNSTSTAVDTSKKAEKAGVDGILTVVPYYNKPSQKGLLTHFGAIAQAVSLPIILYNIPGRTGIDMAPDTVATLAESYQNIIAVKQSNSDLDLVTEIISKTPDDFIVYCGDDSLTLPMLSLGAFGVISVASHFIGKEIKQMIDLFKAGNVKEARAIQYKCFPLFKALFTSPNPMPLKAGLDHWQIMNDRVRPPMITLSDAEKAELFAVLDKYERLSLS